MGLENNVNEENCRTEVVGIKPLDYLRVMYEIAKASFSHPFSITTIKLTYQNGREGY